MKSWYRIVSGVLVVLLFLIGLKLAFNGFENIQSFRQLERIPLTTVAGSVGGEAQLQGTAAMHNHLLQGPKSGKPTLYYRYQKEEAYEDSEGNTKWRVVKRETRSVDFFLKDASGKALLKTQGEQAREDIRWSIERKYYEYEGDYRFSEWRIDPRDEITAFGWLTTAFESQLQSAVSTSSNYAVLSFNHEGDYFPIITNYSAESERRDLGSSAIFSLWWGVTAFIFMCFAFIFTTRQHKVLFFLSLVTVSTFLLLSSLGLSSLHQDVSNGYQRVVSQLEKTENLISKVMKNHGYDYQGLDQLVDFNDPQYSFSAETKDLFDSWRLTSYQVKARYLIQMNRFPYQQYAWLIDANNLKTVALPENLLVQAKKELAAYQPTKTRHNDFLVFVGIIILLVSAWLGFRVIRVKRMQENIIASKVAGIVYGVSETNGTLELLDGKPPLKGPLSKKDCCWYSYTVKEKRGSGKKEKWVTIIDRTEGQDFYCEDDTGRIYIDHDDAEIITRHSYYKNTGSRKYYESSIHPKDDIYVFGHTSILNEVKGDELSFTKDKDVPFIVANYSEEEVKFLKGAKGIFYLSLGSSFLFLCAILLGGSNGNFSATDFLLASMIAPATSFLIMIMLMFNDIVFLKQRAERNFANIQVALKKRFALIPQLTTITKRYLDHEKELHESMVNLRALPQIDNSEIIEGRNGTSALAEHDQSVKKAMASVIKEIDVKVEEHPELKSNKFIYDLHKRVTHIENEVELIRTGFNDAVTQYNTRIALFPDNLIANTFKFKRRSLLSYETELTGKD